MCLRFLKKSDLKLWTALFIYQHVLREVILWQLYFLEGNDVTPHCHCKRNSVLISTFKFPKPNVIVTTAAGCILTAVPQILILYC